MNHSEAHATNASDRYLLGQLGAAEADAFEEHYFDCEACAEDVRLGTRFLEAGRRVVRETGEPAATPAPVIPITSRPRWNRWIPAAAAAAILAIPINVGLLMRMQSAVPRMVQVTASANPADALGTAEFLELGVRAASDPLVVTGGPVYFNVPLVDPPVATYEIQILDAAGKVVSERQHPSQVVDAKQLSVNTDVLQPGNYQLVIFGIEPAGQVRKIAWGDFIVKRRSQRGQLQHNGPRRDKWNSLTTQAPAQQAA